MENHYDHIIGSMKFEVFPPHFALMPYLCSYTMIEGNHPELKTNMHIISNGYVELFMHFDYSCIQVFRHNKWHELGNYIIGINVDGNSIDIGPRQRYGPVKGMIVRFTHKGVRQLMGLKISDLYHEMVTCEDIWGLKGRQLYENMRTEQHNFRKKEILDHFFLELLHKERKTAPIDLDMILRICCEKNERATVENLASKLCISHRTLSRWFENETGICPKEYLKLIRINRICEVLNRRKKIDLPEILYYGGYYDQSHFIKEFREILYITPAELLKNSHGNFYITRGVKIT